MVAVAPALVVAQHDVVAIPALVLYNYFQHSLKNLVFQLDNFIADFIDRARREYRPDGESKVKSK